jgi:two-component system response regulator HydG
MAATRRDLTQMVRDGRFRDDLYFRLAVTRVELPALRDRSGDVALLAQTFWQRLCPGTAMPHSLLHRLVDHDWPGNVRELQNAVARYVALGDLALRRNAALTRPAPTLPRPAVGSADTAAVDPNDSGSFERILDLGLSLPQARKQLVAEFERCYVERALAAHDGNVTRAATASGVGSRYFRLIRARCNRG